MKTDQHRSIRVHDLAPIVMARPRLRQPKQRLVPAKTAWNIFNPNDRPGSFHTFVPSRLAFGLAPRNEVLLLRSCRLLLHSDGAERLCRAYQRMISRRRSGSEGLSNELRR